MTDSCGLRQPTDPIVDQVIEKYKKRSQEGIKKYGTTLADNNLSFDEWLTHLQEELMDAVVYIEKTKEEWKKEKNPSYNK